jgi:hypothetical protein
MIDSPTRRDREERQPRQNKQDGAPGSLWISGTPNYPSNSQESESLASENLRTKKIQAGIRTDTDAIKTDYQRDRYNSDQRNGEIRGVQCPTVE